MCHCRGNARFDLDAVACLLGVTTRIVRLSAEELSLNQVDYGTVNPFSEPTKYIQVFDEDVTARYTPPHTMMTNASDHTWAVEFRAAEVIAALRLEAPQVLVGKITTREASSGRVPVFGIVTGNGPESGMALWRYVNEEIRTRFACERRLRGDLSYPKVIVQSVPEMGLSMELPQRGNEVWDVIKSAVEQLIGCGATHVAIACNTSHYYADRIRQVCGSAAEFVSVVDVTVDYIRQEHARDITIIGIPIVADLGEYSAYRSLIGLGVRSVDEHAKPYLEELAYLVKQSGARSSDTKCLNRLQHVIRSGVRTSQILIALTEASVLLERFPRLRERIGGKVVIDPLRLYGKALAKLYVQSLPQEVEEEVLKCV